MNTHRSKGFTLLEVIVSVAIFAIISVGFFTMFSTVFITTFKSKQVTENAFNTQRQLEESIAEAKSALEAGTTPSGLTPITVTVFSGSNARTVTVYNIVQESTTGPSLEMYVSSVRPPELLVPTITNAVDIEMASNLVVKNNPNIGMANLSINLKNALTVDNSGLLIRYVYHWYLSKGNQYIPSNPPTFPDDYEIITEYSSKTIASIPLEYSGKFVKLVVTPVGEKGKMGDSVTSNAVYLSPFPLNTNLVMHLDASYIDSNDTANQVRKETVGQSMSNLVKKWVALDDTPSNPSQSSANSQPVLNTFDVGATPTNQTVQGVHGKAGVANGALVTPTTPAIGTIADLTVYFAAKFEDAFPSNTMIFQSKANSTTGNRWEFKTNATGNLVLVRYLNNSNTSSSVLTCVDFDYRGNKWKVFKLSLYQDLLAIDVDGETICSSALNTTTTLQLTDFKIAFDSRLTLGEVAVYTTKHPNNGAESASMNSYLKKKFKPE